MKFDNRTNWSTSDIRKVFKAVFEYDEYTPPRGAIVRVVYSRGAKHYSGWATYGGQASHYERGLRDRSRLGSPISMLLRLPVPEHGPINMERFIGLVRHEVGHWRGLKHADMAGSIRHSWYFKFADHPWANGLVVQTETAPKTSMTERVQARAEHAREMLKKHEDKLEREKRLVAKWKAKVKYYARRDTVAQEGREAAQ